VHQKRVTNITNQVLASKHDRLCDIDLHLPERLANYKSFTDSCSEHTLCHDFPLGTLYCTKETHYVLKEFQCRCKLRVKDGPASLKSQCVNKIREFTFYPIPLRKRILSKRKTNSVFKNLRVFNYTASNLLSATKTKLC